MGLAAFCCAQGALKSGRSALSLPDLHCSMQSIWGHACGLSRLLKLAHRESKHHRCADFVFCLGRGAKANVNSRTRFKLVTSARRKPCVGSAFVRKLRQPSPSAGMSRGFQQCCVVLHIRVTRRPLRPLHTRFPRLQLRQLKLSTLACCGLLGLHIQHHDSEKLINSSRQRSAWRERRNGKAIPFGLVN